MKERMNNMAGEQGQKIYEYRGIRGLVAAELITDTSTEIEYGEVQELAGTSQLQKEVATSSATKYYDNIPAIVIDSDGADTVTVDVSAVPLEKIAFITGQNYDPDTGMLIEGERKSKYYAIGYITEDTDGNEVYVWRLKGKFAVPGSTHITKNDGTDSNGQQLVYTGINTTHKFAKTSKTAKAINVEKVKDKVDLSTFFETVQTPDTVKAKTAMAKTAKTKTEG